MILCILSSSSLRLYCRELATLRSSWVDTLWLQCFHPPDILRAPHAPLGQPQRACHPLMGQYSACAPPSHSPPGSLCGSTVESLALITTEAINPSSHSSSHSY